MSTYNLGFRYVIQEIENFDIGTIIECENGNKYELRIAENEQRKFSRKDGTKLRFMTYDNIDKMFRILEEDETIDIDNIEELLTEYSESGADTDIINYINDKIVPGIKQLNKRVKELEELNIEISEKDINEAISKAREQRSKEIKSIKEK